MANQISLHLSIADDQLASIFGGMNTSGFRKSNDIIDRRSSSAIAQDNQSYPGWGNSGPATVAPGPNFGPSGSGNLANDLGINDIGRTPSPSIPGSGDPQM